MLERYLRSDLQNSNLKVGSKWVVKIPVSAMKLKTFEFHNLLQDFSNFIAQKQPKIHEISVPDLVGKSVYVIAVATYK